MRKNTNTPVVALNGFEFEFVPTSNFDNNVRLSYLIYINYDIFIIVLHYLEVKIKNNLNILFFFIFKNIFYL